MSHAVDAPDSALESGEVCTRSPLSPDPKILQHAARVYYVKNKSLLCNS